MTTASTETTNQRPAWSRTLRNIFWEPIRRYMMWLHCRWPAGTVEKLPVAREDGSTNVPGVRIVGDLTGVPLLKFSADTGARAIQAFQEENAFSNPRDRPDDDVVDVAIVGGGVSGISAAIEAKKAGLSFKVFEAQNPFSTIVDFPKGKPIYTYPKTMEPAGEMHFKAEIKEDLVEELEEQRREHGIEPIDAQISHVRRKEGLIQVIHAKTEEVTRARRAVIAIGRSGNFRKLGVPGQDLEKVHKRLHDPKDYRDKQVMVIGGGDSALETAIALGNCGARVTVSYRKEEFSRPKPGNIEKLRELERDPSRNVTVEQPSSERQSTAYTADTSEKHGSGWVKLEMATEPVRIEEDKVVLKDKSGQEKEIENDVVFSMIGREAPLDFFRRSGITVTGDRTAFWWTSLILFFLFCFWLYHWKDGAQLFGFWRTLPEWLSWNPAVMIEALREGSGWLAQRLNDPGTLLGTLGISMQSRSFYYTLAYSLIVFGFGIARIRRRKTPYITAQTSVLMAIQIIPLFILPEIIFPLMGYNGWFHQGFGQWFAQSFFHDLYWDPRAWAAREWSVALEDGHPWAYWRSYGFILAWPLMVWNWFTAEPIVAWLVLGAIQTFVLIPAMIFFWGKGAYCGWICSCGALAETLGDTHRHKMPHGPVWNRLNMIGQVFLLFAVVILIFHALKWAGIGWAQGIYQYLFQQMPVLNYAWFVDLLWAGVIGYGLYFWFSGRVWCRFACPLAALMHIYARFSRFRIFAEKEKCISCNVCTSVCHQGIDVMNFANKGEPMRDPECVRCSACVQQCPTGVLSFGRFGTRDKKKIVLDTLPASPVLMREGEQARKQVAERQLEHLKHND